MQYKEVGNWKVEGNHKSMTGVEGEKALVAVTYKFLLNFEVSTLYFFPWNGQIFVILFLASQNQKKNICVPSTPALPQWNARVTQ